MRMSNMPDDSFSISHEQVAAAYLNAISLIDTRVTPFLGKATTRVLVQVAAKRLAVTYPFLALLEKIPYTDIRLSLLHEHCHITAKELNDGLYALLEECFKGLKELTGDLIEPPLHEEVARQLEDFPH